MKISVMICTHNRAAFLRETLNSFFSLVPPTNYDYELVVVDNGSTDATRVIIAECIALLPPQHTGRLRYGYESRLGLSNARNTALKMATGDVLVFIDDDIWPQLDWLNEIAQEFAVNPSIALLGGRVLSTKEHLQTVGVITRETRQIFTELDGAEMVSSANFAFRRDVLKHVVGFDPRLGAGTEFGGGEDVDFLYRAIKTGFKLLYAPNVTVYKNHDCTTHEQACKLEYNRGKGAVAYFLKHIFSGDIFAAKVALGSLQTKYQSLLHWASVPTPDRERTRAYLRGFVNGLFPALVRMW